MLNMIIDNIPILAGACDFFDSPSANTAFAKIIGLIKLAVRIIQIIVPILLVVLGSVDMTKAVIAGDEKRTNDAKKTFIKRIISAVIVFLIPFIVAFLLSVFKADTWRDCWNNAVIVVNQNIVRK